MSMSKTAKYVFTCDESGCAASATVENPLAGGEFTRPLLDGWSARKALHFCKSHTKKRDAITYLKTLVEEIEKGGVASFDYTRAHGPGGVVVKHELSVHVREPDRPW